MHSIYCGALVAFKLSIDFPRIALKYAEIISFDFIEICSFYKNIEIFIQVHQTVQHSLGKITVSRLFLENP